MRRPPAVVTLRLRLALALAAVAPAACGGGGGATTRDQTVTSSGSVQVATTAAATAAATAATTAPTGPASTPVVVTTSAAAGAPATRLPTTPASTCAEIAAAISERSGTTTQLVIVRTDEWTETTATLELATPSGTGWVCTESMTARVGRQGLRPLADRRSGDDTTPAGVFPLGVMTAWDGQVFSFFGNEPDPGVGAGTYRHVRTGDCFGATANAPTYGPLRRDTSCPGPDDEYLPAIGA